MSNPYDSREHVEKPTRKKRSRSQSSNDPPRHEKKKENAGNETEVPWKAAKIAAQKEISSVFDAILKKVKKVEGNSEEESAAHGSTSGTTPVEGKDHALILIHEKLDALIQTKSSCKTTEPEGKLTTPSASSNSPIAEIERFDETIDLFGLRNTVFCVQKF